MPASPPRNPQPQEENRPDPPFRSVNLARIRQSVEAILQDDVCISLRDAKPDAADFVALAKMLARRLGPGIPLQVIQDSLTHLGDKQLTIEVLQREAHRLSANVQRLRQRRPVGPWKGQRIDEWVLVEVSCMRQRRNYQDELGADVEFELLSGQAATERATKFWSYKLVRFLADKVGFAPSFKIEQNIMEDPQEFSGLKLYVRLLAERSIAPKIYFDKYRCPDSLKAENKQLIKTRKRRGETDFVCPNQFEWPCWKCYVGFDQCPVAVHPRTFQQGFCEECQRESWFDPLRAEAGKCELCLLNARSERIRR